MPLDADLQNDPADVPTLLDKLDQGFDVVSGWRRNRKDMLVTRKIPSWIANALISAVSGVRLHDYGCTLKAYRRYVLQGVHLYGEMHRFIPIYAAQRGARVTEIVVTHHPRRTARPSTGSGRIPNVLLDLILAQMLWKYGTKPMHLFGKFGLLSGGLSCSSSWPWSGTSSGAARTSSPPRSPPHRDVLPHRLPLDPDGAARRDDHAHLLRRRSARPRG